MAKTWGDVFNAAKRRGDDPSYAAFLADEWEKRKKPMTEKQPITGATPFGALAFLPGIVKVAKDRGYALTVHGSLARDFDFVAIPWTEEACPAEELAEAIRARCGGIVVDLTNPCPKPHGRLAWKFHLGGGPYVDLSVMPIKP